MVLWGSEEGRGWMHIDQVATSRREHVLRSGVSSWPSKGGEGGRPHEARSSGPCSSVVLVR